MGCVTCFTCSWSGKGWPILAKSTLNKIVVDINNLCISRWLYRMLHMLYILLGQTGTITFFLLWIMTFFHRPACHSPTLITAVSLSYPFRPQPNGIRLCPTCQSRHLTLLYFRQTATGLILGLHPADERRRYRVTSPLIGWPQTTNLESAMYYTSMCLRWH